jgi:hypothetical protein
LDAEIEQPSDASYLTLSPDATPAANAGAVYGGGFPGQEPPTTPSAGRRRDFEIEALSGLVDAMRGSREEIPVGDRMSLEEEEEEEEEEWPEGEDLDADVEDMDDELESSFIEEDSMDL